VRHTAAHAEVQAGGGQHDVIGPWRQRCNDGEDDERGEEVEFDGRLRFSRC
jgi:hypothetical protein